MSTFVDPFLSDAIPATPEVLVVPPSKSPADLLRDRMRSPRVASDIEKAKQETVTDVMALPPKPFDELPDGSFAQADPMDAGQSLLLIAADLNADGTFLVQKDMLRHVREEMRKWADAIRKRGGDAASELFPQSAKDDAVDALSKQIIAQASKSKTKIWSAALPTGKQIAVVTNDVLASVGVDTLVRHLHKRAIQAAIDNGDPYNDRALALYEAPTPAGAHA